MGGRAFGRWEDPLSEIGSQPLEPLQQQPMGKVWKFVLERGDQEVKIQGMNARTPLGTYTEAEIDGFLSGRLTTGEES